MAYSAKAIANYFLERAKDAGETLDHLQLQKLVYFAHAVYFKRNKEPLIADPVFAWKHGPVIQTLYDALKRYGSGPVTDYLSSWKWDPKNGMSSTVPIVNPGDAGTRSFLDNAYNSLHSLAGWRLRCVSHAKDGAWYKTVRGQNIDPNDENSLRELPRNLVILDKEIMECGK